MVRSATGSGEWLRRCICRGRVVLALAGVAVLAAACGGGGRVNNSSPPIAPTLTIGATIKQLTFSWASVPTATRYRLMQNSDGQSGFTQVGDDLAANATQTTLEVAVHLHDWVNSQYLLQACNGNGCTPSATMSAMGAMLPAIGYFKASNSGTGDSFGYSIAMSGDGTTLAVGAPQEESSATGVDGVQSNNDAFGAGAVYVFRRVGLTWVQQAYVKASNAEASDGFGSSVALNGDGNTLAVGAVGEASRAPGEIADQADNHALAAGAVYVFARSGAAWSQQAYVKALVPRPLDFFGYSIALSGDGNRLAVGAVGEDGFSVGVDGDPNDLFLDNAGAVFVYTRTGTQWSTNPTYVKASNTENFDNFGSSLALSADGNTLAVGAYGEDSSAAGVGGNETDNSMANAGAVYVFAIDGATQKWSQQRYLKASNPNLRADFGWSLSLSADGNTLAVGAYGEASSATGVDGNEADTSMANAGAVYVFTRDATSHEWSQQAYVKASNTDSMDDFGWSLALSADGNTLGVGALDEGSNATGVGGDQSGNDTFNAGAVYVFKRSGTIWSQQTYVKASNTGQDDEFGNSLALSADGRTLAVGAPREASNATGVGGNQTDDNAAEAGAVYMY